MVTSDERILNLVDRVGQLDGAIRQFMAQSANQDQAAQSSRRIVYERLELLSSQVNRVATDVEAVQQDVAEMRNDIDEKIMPEVTIVKNERQQKIGAKTVWVLVGSAVVAVMTALTWVADKLFNHYWPKH